MIKRKRTCVLTAAVCLVMVLSAVAYGACNQPGNLLSNCNFDTFTGAPPRQVPEGWTPWTLMGDPAFDQDNHGSASGAPAQRIWSDGGTWTAGLYQQVQVTPGKGYKAWVEWSPPQCPQLPGCEDIERRMGIDPTGGTDPGSAKVVWGPSLWADVKMGDCHVNAYAQSQTITVFLWTHHPASHGQDQVYFDSVILLEDASMVPPTKAPTNTPTRRPSARTSAPAAVQATDLPTVAPPADTPMPIATATITPTNTATPVRTPTETPNLPPTWTPVPAVAQVAGGIESGGLQSMSRLQSAERGTHPRSGPERWLLVVAAVALVSACVAGGIALVVWQRAAGRRVG